jgi:actin-related protein
MSKDDVNEYNRKWYKNNITEEILNKRREKYKNLTPEQKEKYAETDRKYREIHKDRTAERRKERESVPGYKEKISQSQREIRIKHKEVFLLREAKRRAVKNGLPFDLDISDIVIPCVCPVLGIPIKRDGNPQNKNNSPSLDRLDNAKGYVKGNVRVISWRANHIKNDSTLEELRKVLEYVERELTSVPDPIQ